MGDLESRMSRSLVCMRGCEINPVGRPSEQGPLPKPLPKKFWLFGIFAKPLLTLKSRNRGLSQHVIGEDGLAPSPQGREVEITHFKLLIKNSGKPGGSPLLVSEKTAPNSSLRGVHPSKETHEKYWCRHSLREGVQWALRIGTPTRSEIRRNPESSLEATIWSKGKKGGKPSVTKVQPGD